ncbi:MAG: hypothetical protein Q7J07_01285 [Pelolinea sp.]|nr:hypothetical protein [Pelolinea sp.]
MKKILFIFLLILLFLVTGCSSQTGPSADEAANDYIIALSEKNKPQVVALSCKEWEESAILEVDALLSVDAAVSDLNCTITGESVSEATVICEGSLDLTYSDEIRAIDLSRRTYTLLNEDGQWRVCSYK